MSSEIEAMHESNQPKDLTSNFIPDISYTSVSSQVVVDCNDVVVEEMNKNETNNDFIYIYKVSQC